MKIEEIKKQSIQADISSLELPPPGWVREEGELQALCEKLYIYDQQKKLLDAIAEYTVDTNNAVLNIDDLAEYVARQGSIIGSNSENARELILDFFAKHGKEPYWQLYRSPLNRDEYCAVVQEIGVRHYPLIISQVRAMVTDAWENIVSRQKGAAIPVASAVIKRFQLDKDDIPSVFQRLNNTGICTASPYDFRESDRITVFEFTSTGHKVQVLLPPISSLESFIANDIMPVLRPFFQASLESETLSRNVSRFNATYKKSFSSDQLSEIYVQLKSVLEEPARDPAYDAAAYLSSSNLYQLVGYHIKLAEADTTKAKITNRTVAFYFIYYYLYNSYGVLEKAKKKESSLASDKHSIIRDLAELSYSDSRFRLLNATDIFRFKDAARRRTIKDKYFSGARASSVKDLESLLSLAPSPGKKISKYPEIEDTIPLCLTVKGSGTVDYVLKWTWIYVLDSEIRAEAYRLVRKLAARWETDIELFQQEKKSILIKQEDISPHVLYMIDRTVEFRRMYSLIQLSYILIPNEKEVSLYGISPANQFFSRHILRKDTSRIDMMKLFMEDLLFRNPGKDDVTLRDFTEIFGITTDKVIESSEILKAQTRLGARVKYLIMRLIKSIVSGRASDPAGKKNRKKSRSLKKALADEKQSKEMRDKAEHIRSVYAEGSHVSRLIDRLLKEHFFQPAEQLKKKQSFNKALEENIMVYDQEADYCYISMFALQCLWEEKLIKDYISERIRKLAEYIARFEENQGNKFVIIPEEEKVLYPTRKNLLKKFLDYSVSEED